MDVIRQQNLVSNTFNKGFVSLLILSLGEIKNQKNAD